MPLVLAHPVALVHFILLLGYLQSVAVPVLTELFYLIKYIRIQGSIAKNVCLDVYHNWKIVGGVPDCSVLYIVRVSSY